VPWPKDHKAKVHEKIVAHAAAALRVGGIAGLGVEDVMAQAGLTHGAFYAHFADKDELVREALEYANAQTLERFTKVMEAVPDEGKFRAAVEAYLCAPHVAHPEVGCPVAPLAPELTRAGGKTKRVLAGLVRARLEWLRGLVPKRLRGAAADDAAVGALACMIGGVVLARIVGGEEGTKILESTRRFVDRALGA
jgi:TetR/AcrR family transcriptional repressor of nem operon